MFSAELPALLGFGHALGSIAPTQSTHAPLLVISQSDAANESSPVHSDTQIEVAIEATNLVIIDGAVEGRDQIIASFETRTDGQWEIHILDTSENGVDQLSAIIGSRNDIASLHLFSHGSDGQLQLGVENIDALGLLENAATLQSWQSSFAVNASVLIYGCNVAETEVGQSFIDTFANLTNTDVAASNDLTGYAALGGDWVLEYKTGTIDAMVPVNKTLVAEFKSTLGIHFVTNLNDSGLGSLRTAITFANLDILNSDIIFSTGGGTINLLSELPALTHTVEIDATSVGGYSGDPLIILDGSSMVSGDGLTLDSGSSGSVIKGLRIVNMPGHGLELNNSSNHTIQENYIGTDGYSTAIDYSNAGDGLRITNSSFNTIGGANSSEGNVIAGNTNNDLKITGSGSHDNIVQNNKLGTNKAGTAGINSGAGDGVVITSGAYDNIIGGNLLSTGNIISGGNNDGVSISSVGTNNNIVSGNLIGVAADGVSALGNSAHGVTISGGAQATIVGDDGSANHSGNIISANGGNGVNIEGSSGTHYSEIMGNKIGTDLSGNAAIANAGSGVNIVNSADYTKIGDIGRGNQISANGSHGIYVYDSTDTDIKSNYIGTNALGSAALGNAACGIELNWLADNTDIGGVLAGEGNLVSGNSSHGVLIAGAYFTEVYGNYIGTDATGSFAVGSQANGLQLWADVRHTQIGSSAAGAANVISGSVFAGIIFNSSGIAPNFNTVQGNFLGTDNTGTVAIPNDVGIFMRSGSSNNLIGGDADAGEGNLISGNDYHGVELYQAGTSNNIVAGNKIGTDISGTVALANSFYGMYIHEGASGNTLGGTATGFGNLISGNSRHGIGIQDSDSNQILGNKIGTDVNGNSAIGNGWSGISVISGTQFTVIGSAGNGGNLISGNGDNGIHLSGALDTDIYNNTIGTSISGGTSIANGNQGILLSDGTLRTSIGSGFVDTGNQISGNSDHGILVDGSGGVATQDTTIMGNMIGTNSTGNSAVANSGGGVSIENGAINTQVGGQSVLFEGNVISGNASSFGVAVSGASTSQTVIIGNTIGLDVTGASALANGNGIYILGASDVDVGGTGLGEWNVISGNLLNGILISGPSASAIQVLGNRIGTSFNGLNSVANGKNGIRAENSSNLITIGGASAAEVNYISGNTESGISLSQSSSNTILGNVIGLAVDGSVQGNGQDGIQILAASQNNQIGGNSVGNIISDNRDGIWIDGSTSTSNTIQGNEFGYDLVGAYAGGAQETAIVISNAGSNLIGGDSSGLGNSIINQLTNGIEVSGATALNNALLGNTITMSGVGLAIDLEGDGVSSNDIGDVDAGANLTQNFPIISEVNTDGVGNVDIHLSIDSAANTDYRIEVFASAAAHVSGHGDAERYVGSAVISTDGSGLYSGILSLTETVAIGEFISLSATVQAGVGVYDGSSELSLSVEAERFNVAPVIVSSASFNATENSTAAGTVVANDADLDVLSYSIVGGADAALFQITSATGVVTFLSAQDAEAAADANGDNVYEIVVEVDDGYDPVTQAVSVIVGDSNEFSASSVSDNNGTANEISESNLPGTQVGLTAAAADADISDTITYSLTDSAGGLFQIFSNSGIVSLIGTLDAEVASSHNITVLALSSDGSSSSAIFTIQVLDVNESSVSGVSDSNATANGVFENALVGAAVGISAQAVDTDISDTVSYSLTDSAGGLFQINSASGLVTVAAGLDAETSTSHNITVQALSTDSSTSSSVFTVQVLDINEYSTSGVVDSDLAANQIAENSTLGTVVGVTGSANDLDVDDSVTYSLTDSAGGLFSVNAGSGVVQLNGALDAETSTSHSITLLAQSSDGSSSSNSFTIAILDVNEGGISATSDADAASNAVLENAVFGVTVGISAQATDSDVGDSVSYSLTDSAGGLFQINSASGLVTVAAGLDAELSTSHNITVEALSTDGSTSSSVYTVQILDLNEFATSAVVDSDLAANQIAENTIAGTAVGVTGSANDLDVDDSVTYSLTDSAGGLFSVDAVSGVVQLNGALDAETSTSHSITLLAQSSDGSSSSNSFTIAVLDVNESGISATSDADVASNAVLENAVVGASVGISNQATDSDVTDSISYSLTDSAGGLFQVNSVSGVVTLNGSLDAELAASHNITVLSQSTDGSSSLAVYNIQVVDINEYSTSSVSDSDATPNQLAENSLIGATTGVNAAAVDQDINDTITYSLTDSAGGLFQINSVSGLVTLNGALNAESATSHTITVQALSSDGSSSGQSYTIQVLDVNESAISNITDSDVGIDEVLENSLMGTVLGITAQATDTDVDDTVSYSLTDSAGGLFQINNTSGVVSVSGTLDAEASNFHNITVQALSTDGSSSNQNYTVVIIDLNETGVSTVTDNDAAINEVYENATIGATVGLSAIAGDLDIDDTVSYSLTDSAGGLFTINPVSGLVQLNGSLDAELSNNHSITVQVLSSDGSSSSTSFSIAVLDANESAVGPIADIDGNVNAVLENSISGTNVGVTVFASDSDISDTVSYSLIDSAGGLFQIDGITGVVSVNGSIDAEQSSSYRIVANAQSSDGSQTQIDIDIAVLDANEFVLAGIVDTDSSPNGISEGAAIGSSIGLTALAVDTDISDSVSYSLSGADSSLFDIDAISGVVTLNGLLDYEVAQNHRFDIIASSTDGSVRAYNVDLLVVDVNESPVGLITDNNLSSNQVFENAGIGVLTGITASAMDPDGSDSVSYSLLNQSSSMFAIDSVTGVVSVNAALDAESSVMETIEVHATSTDGSQTIAFFTLTILNVNEYSISQVSDVDAALNQVQENTTIGSELGVIVNALDADINDTVQYSLVNSGNGLFSIDAQSGKIAVAGPLDAELSSGYALVVQAESTDGSSSLLTIDITVLDINDNAISQVSDTDLGVNTVDENSDIGTAVGIRAVATDHDQINSISYRLTDSANGLFSIDSDSGEVSVAGALDAEVATEHTIIIEATSTDGSTSSVSVGIVVADINESPEMLEQTISIEYGYTGVIGELKVTDPDTGDVLTYTLETSDANSALSVNEFGEITQSHLLKTGYYQLNVIITDDDGSSVRGLLTVYIGSEPALGGAIGLVSVLGNNLLNAGLTDALNVGYTAAHSAQSGGSDTNQSGIFGNTPGDGDTFDAINAGNEYDSIEGGDAVEESTSDTRLNSKPTAKQGILSSEDVFTKAHSVKLASLHTAEMSDDRQANKNSVVAGRDLILEILLDVEEGEEADLSSLISVFGSNGISLALTPALAGALEGLRDDIESFAEEEEKQRVLVSSTVTFINTTLTLGFLTWLLQSGSLVATAVTTSPLWRSIDPIPVLRAKPDGQSQGGLS